jgi:large subunit ribosomal protein L3
MKTILGHKIGMTQMWDPSGRLVAATIVEAKPNTVVAKTDTQTTIATTTRGKASRAQQPLADKIKTKAGLFVKTVTGTTEDELTVSQFTVGDKVKITGITKGKGFAGVVKRHGFAGWPSSHGHSHQRRPGSIGAQQPQHVVKGKKMAGRMGGEQLTVRGNKILAINPELNLLVISGAIPGPKRARVMIAESN